MRSQGLAFGDLDQVGQGEDDAAAVQVIRDLLAIRTSAQGALGDRGQAVSMQDLDGCRGREDPWQFMLT